MLLAFTEGEGQGPRILTVKIRGLGSHIASVKGLEVSRGQRIRPVLEGQASILGVLASLVSLQEEPITSLEVTGTTSCRTEEEGMALAGLLGRCSSWKLGVLDLEGGVGRETWQGLRRAAGKGKLEQVKTTWKVLRRGEEEDVKKVWKKSQRSWTVEGWRVGWDQIEHAFIPLYIIWLALLFILFLNVGLLFYLHYISTGRFFKLVPPSKLQVL